MPSFKTLEDPTPELASVVYSLDGEILGSYYLNAQRIRLPVGKIPSIVKKALIAVEDQNFYSHAGVDLQGIMGAVWATLRGERRGGSTITQQLARNLYDEVGVERTLHRKLKEIIVAIYLERRYSKEEILTMYLNTVPFGGVVYGIAAAARSYYGKDVSQLTVPEVALLIGLLKGPTYYSPYRHPERARQRRNLVLQLMYQQKFISKKTLREAMRASLGVGDRPYAASQSTGIAPYFREHLRLWLEEWCSARGLDLYRDGLQIYTTIDANLQRYAEAAVAQHMSQLQEKFSKEIRMSKPWEKDTMILHRAVRRSERYNMLKSAGVPEAQIWKSFYVPRRMRLFSWQNPHGIDTLLRPIDSIKYYLGFLEAGVVTIEPQTGHIKAWVGSINHHYFKYDHVSLGKRQVGSTFKPIVYTVAFDNGYSPCYEELNVPVEIRYQYEGRDTVWRPRNATREVGERVSLRKALALSLNIITARLMKAIGPQAVVEYAHRMGITSPLEPVYALALGSCDLNILELTSAYGVYPTLGVWHEPIFVREIRDRNKNVLATFSGQSRRALSEKTAYLMVEMLRFVVNAGTAGELRWRYGLPYSIDIGGKTGTTQNHADGWFVGFTPNLVTGVWVGSADRSVHFQSLEQGQGARMAMPIWAYYMKAAYEDKALHLPRSRIQPPAGVAPVGDCQVKPAQELEMPDELLR
ncbi:MAG: penicillin-binding protein 1A [Bacteroidia bacterium]